MRRDVLADIGRDLPQWLVAGRLRNGPDACGAYELRHQGEPFPRCRVDRRDTVMVLDQHVVAAERGDEAVAFVETGGMACVVVVAAAVPEAHGVLRKRAELPFHKRNRLLYSECS